MKSGGRGARYALNLCTLLEQLPAARLTKTLYDQWTSVQREEAVQYGKSSMLAAVDLPELGKNADLVIFTEPIEKLRKSNVYPYGLTEQKIKQLVDSGIRTVGDLAAADDKTLDDIPYIGEAMVTRIRNVLGQAIWM